MLLRRGWRHGFVLILTTHNRNSRQKVSVRTVYVVGSWEVGQHSYNNEYNQREKGRGSLCSLFIARFWCTENTTYFLFVQKLCSTETNDDAITSDLTYIRNNKIVLGGSRFVRSHISPERGRRIDVLEDVYTERARKQRVVRPQKTSLMPTSH